jgi:hypothetical protein
MFIWQRADSNFVSWEPVSTCAPEKRKQRIGCSFFQQAPSRSPGSLNVPWSRGTAPASKSRHRRDECGPRLLPTPESRTPTVFIVVGEQLKGRKFNASPLANSHLRLAISCSTPQRWKFLRKAVSSRAEEESGQFSTRTELG